MNLLTLVYNRSIFERNAFVTIATKGRIYDGMDNPEGA